MERLARLVIRRRGIVIGVWLVLTVFGAYSAARVSNRWLESFSIPGYSAYETNQRTLQHVRQRRAVPARRGDHRAGPRRDEGRGSRGARSRPRPRRTPAGATATSSRRATRCTSRRTGTRRSRRSSRRATRASHRLDGEADARCAAAGRARGLDVRTSPATTRCTRRRRAATRAARACCSRRDRRARRARDPALRLRHAAGRRDAVARRDRVDPEHVHARLVADVRHRRLDRRAVPRSRSSGSASRSTTPS